MAYELPIQYASFVASADLSTKVFYAGALDTNGAATVQTTAGAMAFGIIQEPVTAGKVTSLMTMGISKAVYGGTVAVLDSLTTDSSGRLVKSLKRTDYIVGIALEAGAINEQHSVFLTIGEGSNLPAFNTIAIPVQLPAITGNIDVVTAMLPGYAGTITGLQFLVSTPATTASKLATLNPYINAAAVTGGAVALTSANCTPLGAKVAGSAVTALNSFGPTDTISIKATGVTAFVEGQGVLLITTTC